MDSSLEKFAPPFYPDQYSKTDRYHLAPFFTNLDRSVYVPLIFSPELIGALCSRASRAAHDLRYIYLNEYLYPFVNPTKEEKETDQQFQEKIHFGQNFKEFIDFLNKHPVINLFSHPRARSFYIKWLAQYGDDSIAQMAGSHLVFSGISQVAIKHFEDQRIGLAPIEKSTRYINYSQKVSGNYLYYTDPTFKELGLEQEYRQAMNGLFDTYTALMPKLVAWLKNKFPQEKPSVSEKKGFDVLRGLLPASTLSQVAFFGNGQAFEHMISRSLKHFLGEIRWLADAAYDELAKITPSFLRRIKDEEKQKMVDQYQRYLAEKGRRVQSFVKPQDPEEAPLFSGSDPEVNLIEYDPEGENKIIAGMLYSSPSSRQSWESILGEVRRLNIERKKKIVEAYLAGRTERWQKVGRAFENAFARFEILVNIGAWRDIHRHRMLSQQRQSFSCFHGYDVPLEVIEAGIEDQFRFAIRQAEDVFSKVVKLNPELAQYAVTLAHRLRFMQWENLRQSFWQIELRTIPEGHPDYRHLCQKKFQLLEKAYPLLAPYMRVNLGEYDFARRGQEERIQEKFKRLSKTA